MRAGAAPDLTSQKLFLELNTQRYTAMAAVITKSQLAQELGVTRGAVTGYVRRGMPVDFNGELNRAEALAWIRGGVEPHHADRGAAVAADVSENTAEPRTGRRGDGDGRTALADERARLACAQADMQEMKNAALRGALLPRDEVPAAVQACFSLVRARLIAIPTRAAPQVVLLKSMPEVKALLTALIHEALQELAETKVVALAEGAAVPGPDPGMAADDDAGDDDLPDDNA